MGQVLDLNGNDFDDLVISGAKVFAEFYSNSCGPCKMLSFVLDDVAKDIDDVKIVKVNFDSNKETVEKYKVQAYPTMILFEDGKEVRRIKGLQQKPLIIKAIKGN